MIQWLRSLLGAIRRPCTSHRLRRDPFEKAQHNANTYNDWFLDRAFVLVPIQALAARFLQTMQDYSPSQTLGSFNLSAIEAQIEGGLGN